MRIKQIPIVSVFAALVFVCGTTVANAEPGSHTCQKLEAQLSDAQSAMDPASLQDAVKVQRIELAKVRGQAAAMNCLGGTENSGQSHSSFSCQSLIEAIGVMKDNLSRYERLAKTGKTATADRDALLADWKKNDCDPNEIQATNSDAQSGVIIYGQDPIETGSVIELGSAEPPESREPVSGSISHIRVNLPESVAMSGMRGTEGSYITMCVRTCDGYYFPASYTSGTPNFGNDSDLCNSRCPNSDTELYYYSVPGQDTRDMISLSGKKYMDQPFALKYRKRKPGEESSCSCRSASDFSVIGGNGSENEFSLLTGSIAAEAIADGSPKKKGQNDDFAEKVRAALNAKEQKEVDPAPVASITSSSATGKVRVVGPRFFPDPKEGAILRSPGPNPDQ